MKNVPCHISKQRMLQPSSHRIIATPMVSPAGTQDGDKWAAHCQALSHCSHPQLCTLRTLRMVKSRILAQIAEVHIKGIISVSPDSCIFPYIEKWKFLWLEIIWFSLINNNLLMSWLLVFVAKTLIYPGSLFASLEPSFRAIWEFYLPGLKSSECLPNKMYSQLLGCAFSFSGHDL